MKVDVLSPEWDRDPYPFYEYLREHEPLHHSESVKAYLLSRYEDVQLGFRSMRLTSEHYVNQVEPAFGGRTIIVMEGLEHSRHRRLVAPAFKGSELMQKYLPVIHAQADTLIAQFKDTGQVDLRNQFTTHYPISVIGAMLGLPAEDLPMFERWYHSFLAFMENFAGDPEVTAHTIACRTEMEHYMYPLIEQRTRRPGDDLLSTLCVAEIDGHRMTPVQIKAFVSNFMLAGGETTDTTISNMFVNLIQHPDVMSALRADRGLLPAVIAETLRYSPPIHVILRQTAEEVEFTGGVVPAGQTVMLLMGAAHRDPRKYQDPDSFSVNRPDLDVQKAFGGSADHLAFGYGRHFCIGSMLAKIEIEIAVNKILDLMEEIEFDGEVPSATGLIGRAVPRLNLRFKPAA